MHAAVGQQIARAIAASPVAARGGRARSPRCRRRYRRPAPVPRGNLRLVMEGRGNRLVLETHLFEADGSCDLSQRFLGHPVSRRVVVDEIHRAPEHHLLECSLGHAVGAPLEFAMNWASRSRNSRDGRELRFCPSIRRLPSRLFRERIRPAFVTGKIFVAARRGRKQVLPSSALKKTTEGSVGLPSSSGSNVSRPGRSSRPWNWMCRNRCRRRGRRRSEASRSAAATRTSA
jgi:hypothetical protein